MKTPKTMKTPDFAFFGTSHIARYVLEELNAAGYLPRLIVTVPAKPQGRTMEIRESAVAQWAREHGIDAAEDWSAFENASWDLGIVVDYGKILPKRIIDRPRRGFLNVHPSLLPRFRGPSPIRSAILSDERATGVSIIALDEEMDHGPIVAQKKVTIPDWPPKNAELERLLMTEGGRLLAQVLVPWTNGEIEAQPQNHDVATYCEKLTKADGLLDLSEDPYRNLLKIRALEGWPSTYAFFERAGKRLRVQILDAHLEQGALAIDYVKPEGKGVMSYSDFARSGAKPIPPSEGAA